MDNQTAPKRRGPRLRAISLAEASPPAANQEPVRSGPRLRQIEAKAVYREQAAKPEPQIDPSCDEVKNLSLDALKDLMANPTELKLPAPTPEELAWEAVRNWPKYEPVPLGTKRKRGGQLVDLRRTLLKHIADGLKGEKMA